MKYIFSFSKEQEQKTGVLTGGVLIHNFFLFAIILTVAMIVYAFLSTMFEDLFNSIRELVQRVHWLYFILIMLMMLIWMIGYFASIPLIPKGGNDLIRWRSARNTSNLIGSR